MLNLLPLLTPRSFAALCSTLAALLLVMLALVMLLAMLIDAAALVARRRVRPRPRRCWSANTDADMVTVTAGM